MATLVSASEATKYAVASTVGREALVGPLEHVDRHRGAARDVAQRRTEPAVGEDGGMDAAGEVAQLADRALGLVAGLADELERVLAAVQPLARDPQVQGDGHEPLLRAVVQVALQPPALAVGGGDDARLRGAQVDHARVQLDLAARRQQRPRHRGVDAGERAQRSHRDRQQDEAGREQCEREREVVAPAR